MFTLVAFSESQAADAALNKVNGVPDQHVKVTGTQITVGKLNQLVGEVACIGSTGLEARLVSPSLRRINPYFIQPVDQALVPSDIPGAYIHGESPVPLETNETLEAEEAGAVLAARQVTIGVMLADGPLSPVSGELHTINAEVAVALVVGAWAFAQLTFPDSLPVGSYRVVGARVIAANGVLFRLVPVGESHRPGGTVAQSPANADPYEQRMGRMGEWFSFDTTQPPGIEILASAAVGLATYQVYLDVIKG